MRTCNEFCGCAVLNDRLTSAGKGKQCAVELRFKVVSMTVEEMYADIYGDIMPHMQKMFT